MAATLKCDTLQNASSATANITLDTAGNATVGNTLAMGSSFLRNRIINGDMRIAQRGTSAVTTDNAFPVDRFPVPFSTDGAFSAVQDTVAPTGYVNSLKFTATTADASLSAAQYAVCWQNIEGVNIADLGWGTASAQAATVSFWVRSTLTGTFAGSLRNSAANRSYVFTYTISSANTWEYKTVTIPGDTSGTWLTDTNIGIRLTFSLGVGSNFQGTAGSWAGVNGIGTSSSVSVIGTLNATWAITGVQLEVGNTATPFERRQYGQELMLCQRYCQVTSGAGLSNNYQRIGFGQASSTSAGLTQLYLKTTMRVAPSVTITASNTFAVYDGVTITALNGGPTQDAASSPNISVVTWTVSGTPLTTNRMYELIFNNTASGSMTLSAEL